MTLHCGVREGALAAHYSARWLKDTSVLKNDNVSREKDFSLHTEAVKLSDAGAYHCEVTISAEGGDYNIEIPTIILIVFGEFLNALNFQAFCIYMCVTLRFNVAGVEHLKMQIRCSTPVKYKHNVTYT